MLWMYIAQCTYSDWKPMPKFHSKAFRIIRTLCLLVYEELFPNKGAIRVCNRAKLVLFNIFICCIVRKQNQLAIPHIGFWVVGCIFVPLGLHSKRISIPDPSKFNINSVIPNRISNKLCKRKFSLHVFKDTSAVILISDEVM